MKGLLCLCLSFFDANSSGSFFFALFAFFFVSCVWVVSQKNKISSLHLYTERALSLSFVVHFFSRILLLITIIIRRRIKSRRNTLFDFDSGDDDDSNDEDQREERDVLFFRGRRERRTFDSRC